MSTNRNLTVGIIGAGTLGQVLAAQAVAAGYRVKLSNSRGPESLKEVVARLGANASAGTTAEAAQADLVIFSVLWDQVHKALDGLPDWGGRVVIDATNQWGGPGTEIADLGDQTGSEYVAALMPGARVVKALNTLVGAVIAEASRNGDRLIAFLAGDDADAKDVVSKFADSIGLEPVDLGGLSAGRLMQVGSGPFPAFHAVKLGAGH
jgi:8-hydroxy-5-deazaflavin:NADPH oxidoreductase